MARKPNSDISTKALVDDADYIANSPWGEDRSIPMSSDVLKYLFATEDWVFIAIDLLATESTGAKFRVMKRVPGPEGKSIVTPAEDHPVNEILANPYSELKVGQSSFAYLMACEYFLGGNFLAWKHKGKDKKTKLLPLSFDRMQVQFSKTGELESYLCTILSEESPVPKKLVLPASEVLHIRKTNPFSLYWGMSPLLAGKRSIAFNKLSQEYLNNFYFKGAAPQMVLETETNVNTEQLSRMVKAFEQAYTGRKNLRRTLALPKGVTAKAFNVTIADQRLIELIRMNRENILNLLHVPKHAVGLQEAGSLGSNEYKTALQYLWTSTLIPTLNVFAETMTLFFDKELGSEYIIQPDTGNVSVLKEDLLAKASLAEKMLQTLTLNEVRQAVWSRDPIQGGDTVVSLQPIPGVPDEMQPQAPTKPNSETPPPQTTPTTEPEGATETPPPKKQLLIDPDVFLGTRKALFDDGQKAANETVAKNMVEVEGIAGNTLLKMAEAATKEILRYKMLKADIDEDELRARIVAAFEDMEEAYVAEMRKSLGATMEIGANLGVNTVFGAPDPAAIEAIVARDEAKRRLTLEAREIKTFANISETTTEQIMKKVETGLATNQTVTEIAKEVLTSFEETAWTRAQTIARTETLTAMSIGQAAAMKAAKAVIPGLKKVWVTSGDERVRGTPGGPYDKSKADHHAMHGQVQDANEAFVDPKSDAKLQFPRDPKAGHPEDTINCRCTWLTAHPDDLQTILAAVGG